MSDDNLFYLQDSRRGGGGDVSWWKKGGRGYTFDLQEAEIYCLEKAQAQHNARVTDIPWPKGYIDAAARLTVDIYHIHRNEALLGTGVVLRSPWNPRS